MSRLRQNTVFGFVSIIIFMLVMSGYGGYGALASEVVSEAAPVNMLVNPGFEEVDGNAAVGWRVSGGWDSGKLTISPDVARSGNSGLKIESDIGEHLYAIQDVQIEGGRTYEISAWVRSDRPTTNDGALKYELYGGSAHITEDTKVFTSTTEWQEVKFEFEAPAGATLARIFLRRRFNPGHIYYDDAVFKMTGIAGAYRQAFSEPDLVGEVLAGKRSEAYVTWWGFDPDDSTDYLQAAIDSGVSRLIIPNVGQDWIIRPVFLRSNLELVLEDGVVVTAKKGEFQGGSESLFTARDVENLVIRGYGATLRMQKDDYADPTKYTKAEWRMGIALRGSNNVEIAGLTIRDTGGDGIYLGRGHVLTHNENVVIRDVIADNNYRQGMSVITAKNLLIENSIFKNTWGTAPEAGIDFEPNHRDEVLQNIVIRNTVFENNAGSGIAILAMNLRDDSAPVSFRFENIIIRGNKRGFRFYAGAAGIHPPGSIELRDCVIQGTELTGIHLLNKEPDDMTITIEDCYLDHVAVNPPEHHNNPNDSVPIFIGARNSVGNITLNNIVVADDRNRPVLYAAASEQKDQIAFHGIKGSLKVVNPHGAAVRWEGLTEDVSVSVTPLDAVTIPYDRVVSLPAYSPDPVDIRLKPTIHLRNPNLLSIPSLSRVRGILKPDIDLVNFDADATVENVRIEIDDHVIYDLDHVPDPESVKFDTTTLEDGRHTLVVSVTSDKYGVMEERVVFSTDNFRYMIDPFEGPKQVAWFGTVYNPLSISQSTGWSYDTDDPEKYFGDTGRKVHSGLSDEYIVWETPGLLGFELEVYVDEPLRDDAFEVFVSSEQTEWIRLSYDVEEVETSPSGRSKLVVSGTLSPEQTFNYFRLALPASDEPREIQLGQATFRLFTGTR